MTTGYDLTDLGIRVKSGGELAVASGGSIDVESGGSLKIAGTAISSNATEINQLDGTSGLATGRVGSVTFTVNAEGGNVINVDAQLKDLAGNNVAAAHLVYYFLSDDSGGAGIATTAPDTDLTVGTNGTAIEELTADKSGIAMTSATGALDIDVAESGSGGNWYLVVQPLGTGVHGVSGQITFT